MKANIIRLREMQAKIIQAVNEAELTPHEIFPVFNELAQLIKNECEKEYQQALEDYAKTNEDLDEGNI